MRISSVKYLRGEITLPGDKSISHRAALFSAIAEGSTRIENFALSQDCLTTLGCLSSLGVEISRHDSVIYINGVGKYGLLQPEAPLDCGNSGTTVRLISGILAGQNFDSELIGDESLSERPMSRIIEPLIQMNASIESNKGFLPMTIRGRNQLNAVSYTLPVASAQVKSCILLAGLYTDGITKVQGQPSRNHTELMLKYLGANIEERSFETEVGIAQEVSIDGNSILKAKNLIIPSDISSGAFFIVAAACMKESDILIRNVGLNPTRTAFIEVMQNFGANIKIAKQRINCGEIAGDLRILGARSFDSNNASHIISGDVIANLIDEVPILAVLGTQLPNGLEIRNAEELRVKESDRISAVVENLKKMGAAVEEFPDGFRVERSNLKGATIDSFGDHRIAMAFAVAGLFAEGKTNIVNPECVAVSFPEFFNVLNEITVQ